MSEDSSELVLKEELAKMARAVSPAIWLKDAHEDIENWIPIMPGAREKRLKTAITPETGELLVLASLNDWGRVEPFATFHVSNTTIRCRRLINGTTDDSVITDEQELISTIIQALCYELAIADIKVAA